MTSEGAEVRVARDRLSYLKEVGKINQQTFIDTYSRAAFAKVYDGKIGNC